MALYHRAGGDLPDPSALESGERGRLGAQVEAVRTHTTSTLWASVRAIRLGVWIVPVLAFAAVYLWRPLALGFYSDDWSGITESGYHGGPFSLERLVWVAQNHAYSRPLQVLQQWAFTSVLGGSTVAWQLLMAILVAVSYLLLRRFLLVLGVRSPVATISATVWLVLPWSLGYTAWPTTSTVLLSLICFLVGSVALLRRHLWSSVAWFAASMLFYEAFYFQFGVILVILLASRETRRWALTRAAPALIVLQGAIAGANRLSAHVQLAGLSKTYDRQWPSHLARWLYTLVDTLSHAMTGPHSFALAVIVAGSVIVLVLAAFVKGRKRRVTLLAVVLGFFLASIVVALAHYQPTALFRGSRVFVAMDVWMIVFLAVAWPDSIRRRGLRLSLVVGTCFLIIVLTLSTAARTLSWHRWWQVEQTVLHAVPDEALSRLPADAALLVRSAPSVDGQPAFDYWGMASALGCTYPATRVNGEPRLATIAHPGDQVWWDGSSLVRNGSVEARGGELWVWTFPAARLEKVKTTGLLLE